jgi:cellulose synthase (UDP-forming)
MQPKIHTGTVNKTLLWINVVMAFVYFSWWFVPSHMGHPLLYALLFIGEVYHVVMALSFWHTIYPANKIRISNFEFRNFNPSVDIFITVVSEPIDVLRQTAIAARDQDYKNHRVYFLNDGRVAKHEGWKQVEELAHELGMHCITRTIPGGAKAGNINNALKQTNGDIVVIFDTDMIPHRDFLSKTIPYFQEDNVGFVQTPQYYKNHYLNDVTGGAWEQQELFFGPIMRGKEKSNAAFICGTNVAIRRTALMQAGGMCEDNIAEDFLTSLFIHQNGWKSYYVPDVLCEGLAPEDFLSYYKQQLRWARGSLEVLFSVNPVFKKDLTWRQKLEYLSSALYYFNGVVFLIDITMPLIFLFTGIQPVAATTTSFALFFVPFMFLNLFTLYQASDKSVTFRAIGFSQGSFVLQLQAIKSVLLKQKMAFAVTPKQAQEGNFLFLVYPHLAYIVLTLAASYIGISREGLNPSVMTNIAWALLSILMFMPYVRAAYNWTGLWEKIFPTNTQLSNSVNEISN